MRPTDTQGLAVDALDISFDAPTGQVTVASVVADQVTKEKVILCCGNVAKVEMVNDMLVVNEPEPESQRHVVVSGDNLFLGIAVGVPSNGHPYRDPWLRDPGSAGSVLAT